MDRTVAIGFFFMVCVILRGNQRPNFFFLSLLSSTKFIYECIWYEPVKLNRLQCQEDMAFKMQCQIPGRPLTNVCWVGRSHTNIRLMMGIRSECNLPAHSYLWNTVHAHSPLFFCVLSSLIHSIATIPIGTKAHTKKGTEPKRKKKKKNDNKVVIKCTSASAYTHCSEYQR